MQKKILFFHGLKMKDNNNRVNDIISTPSPKKQETKKK